MWPTLEAWILLHPWLTIVLGSLGLGLPLGYAMARLLGYWPPQYPEQEP